MILTILTLQVICRIHVQLGACLDIQLFGNCSSNEMHLNYECAAKVDLRGRFPSILPVSRLVLLSTEYCALLMLMSR